MAVNVSMCKGLSDSRLSSIIPIRLFVSPMSQGHTICHFRIHRLNHQYIIMHQRYFIKKHSYNIIYTLIQNPSMHLEGHQQNCIDSLHYVDTFSKNKL